MARLYIRFWRGPMVALGALAMVLAATQPAAALDHEHRQKAEKALAKAFEYLREAQNEDGSWTPRPGPAVTGLVVAGMLESPEIDRTEPAVARGIEYILKHQKSDGGIYGRILPNYNTSISLMALGRIRNAGDDVNKTVKKAQDFLAEIQWSENREDPNGKQVEKGHPWYGGAGYGDSGRPDLSNTATMIAGLHDSGLVCTEPAYQRAMTFISRLQGTEQNKQYGDQIVQDGGFIYATSKDKQSIGELQSYAVPARTDAEGGVRSRLRTYGTMTYAGFMSFLYAKLDRDDPRVRQAFDWIRNHYTLSHNPGMNDIADTEEDERFQGYYYYLHLMSRALQAWGDPVIEDADGQSHEWANELIDKLVSLQNENGSWLNERESRWMEDNTNLCTAYAVLALQHALQ